MVSEKTWYQDYKNKILTQLYISDGLYVQQKDFFSFISIYRYCRKRFFTDSICPFLDAGLALQRAEGHTTGCHHEWAEMFFILKASPELWHLTWKIKIVILQPASCEKSSRMPSVYPKNRKVTNNAPLEFLHLWEFQQRWLCSFSCGKTEPKVQFYLLDGHRNTWLLILITAPRILILFQCHWLQHTYPNIGAQARESG